MIGVGVLLRLAFRRSINESHVRIANGCLLKILVNRGTALLIAAFDFDHHLRATGLVPLDLGVLLDQRFLLLRTALHFEAMCRGFGSVREMIFIGLPVVSWPYVTVAEIPIPAGRGSCVGDGPWSRPRASERFLESADRQSRGRCP